MKYLCASGVPHIFRKISTRSTSLFWTLPQSKVYTKNYGLPKLQESQFQEFQDSWLGSFGTKWHLDATPMAMHREYLFISQCFSFRLFFPFVFKTLCFFSFLLFFAISLLRFPHSFFYEHYNFEKTHDLLLEMKMTCESYFVCFHPSTSHSSCLFFGLLVVFQLIPYPWNYDVWKQPLETIIHNLQIEIWF